jgi:sRNA-binding carbon storage regulator CsrA
MHVIYSCEMSILTRRLDEALYIGASFVTLILEPEIDCD